jgi:hypothetical protein
MDKIVIAAALGGLLAASATQAAYVSKAQLEAFKPAPAQALVDGVIARHPDMLDMLLHVTPPGGRQNLVIASHIPQNLGEISGEDDLGVAKTGKPIVEVQKDGVRIGVLLPLYDGSHRSIGAVGLMFPWHQGDSQASVLKRAVTIRDHLARKIPSRASLFG